MKLLLLLIMSAVTVSAQYAGSGSVTRGVATTTIPTLYECTGGRPTALGTISASDGTTWTVPADVRFQDPDAPFASDLYEQCTGATYRTTAEALSHLDGSDVVVIDPDGELITGFIFADNYVEVYVNGHIIGKDKVPFTPFNSCIVRFRVQRPFTIAMLLVDWEEHLGLGSETNNGVAYHPGDGGMVGLFRNEANEVVAITNAAWKAQTFYTAPIKDLSCLTEVGSLRLSVNCDITGTNNGDQYYAVHWPIPDDWSSPSFDDASWPNAMTYTNAEVGVNNKPAYTNFPDVFDDVDHDAQFIWSSNLVLDNCVIVRTTVGKTTSVQDDEASMPCVGVRYYDLLGALIWYSDTDGSASIPLLCGAYIKHRLFRDGRVQTQLIIR